ncbi:hypothetical protein GGR57DRAFT_292375 [Xylariaceae sp. FL1272]|nr:hypothetical protein GGR57DRAFT_292375 [Xylariaceae sp. FL1272]
MSDHGSSSGTISLSERLETGAVDPQLSSPLFNGRIPAEIRTMIFEYAVTEFLDTNAFALPIETFQVRHSHDPAPAPDFISPYLDHDFESRLEKAFAPSTASFRTRGRWELREVRDGYDWLRFDNAQAMKPSVTLLFTCRRAYLETRRLPMKQIEMRIYCMNGPAFLDYPYRVARLPKKYDAVRFMRLYVQQFWLEDHLLRPILRYSSLEHLRITLRRTDWWNWESNAALRINPFRGNSQNIANVSLMHQAMSNPTGNPDFNQDAWGKAFSKFPQLKSLCIDFETTQDNRSEMDSIVDWAVTWKLPLSNGRHLSAEGRPIEKLSWRGFAYHNSGICNQCGFVSMRQAQRRPCTKCDERVALGERGYGPQLLVWTLSWVAVPDTLS